MNKNPDKWIRKAISERINDNVVNGVTVPCVDVNYTGETQPLVYVQMTTQTKEETTFTKCYDMWDCTILLDATTRYLVTGNPGSRVLLNDIEEMIINAMNGFTVDGGFEVDGEIKVASSTGMDGHTDTEVYFRQLIRYRIKLIEL